MVALGDGDVGVSSLGTLGTWLASGPYAGFSFTGRLRVVLQGSDGEKVTCALQCWSFPVWALCPPLLLSRGSSLRRRGTHEGTKNSKQRPHRNQKSCR